MTDPPGVESERRIESSTAATPRTRQALLVVFILVVAGVFDAISGNPVDSILLFSVGVLLAVFPDGREPDSTRARPRRRLGVITIAVTLATAFAIVVGGFERHTWPVTIGVLVPGVTALTLAWRAPSGHDPGPKLELGQVFPWMAVFIVLGLFELANLLLQPGLTIDSFDHPTLSVLSDTVLSGHPGRSVGLLVWLLMGAYLIDR